MAKSERIYRITYKKSEVSQRYYFYVQFKDRWDPFDRIGRHWWNLNLFGDFVSAMKFIHDDKIERRQT